MSPPSPIRRVALFRARDDAARSATELAARGFAPILAPVVEIRALEAELPEGCFEFALATSAHALAKAPRALLAALADLPLYVVGERTAAAARAAGFARIPVIAPDAAALLAPLRATPGRAIYLAGHDRRPELEAALATRLVALAVYEARELNGWDVEQAAAVAGAQAALHYSPRSAELAIAFAAASNIAAAFQALQHICISPAAAEPLLTLGAHPVCAERPTQAALFAALQTVGC